MTIAVRWRGLVCRVLRKRNRFPGCGITASAGRAGVCLALLVNAMVAAAQESQPSNPCKSVYELSDAEMRKPAVPLAPQIAMARAHSCYTGIEKFKVDRTAIAVAFRAGKKAEAVEAANRFKLELAAAKSSPEIELLRVEAESDRAGMLFESDALDEADAIYVDLASAHERSGRAPNPRYLSTLFMRSNIAMRKGDIRLLETLRRRVYELSSTVAGLPVDKRALYWQGLGVALMYSSKDEEAVAVLREASLFAERELGAEHPVASTALHNWASALERSGRYAESVELRRRLLATSERLTGPESQESLTALYSLALTLGNLGQVEESRTLLERVYAVVKSGKMKITPNIAIKYVRAYATASDLSGKNALALSIRQDAERMALETLGAGHPLHADAMLDLSRSLEDAGRRAEAIVLLRQAIAIYSKQPNYSPRDLAYAKVSLAANEGDAAAYARASEVFQEARQLVLGRLRDSKNSVGIVEQYRPTLQRYVMFALARKDASAAFNAIQVAQLGDLDKASSALLARSVANPEIAEKFRRLQDQNLSQSRSLSERNQASADGRVADIPAIDAKINDLQKQIAESTEELERLTPGLLKLADPEPVRLSDVQSQMKPEDALLFNMESGGKVVSFLVSRRNVRWSVVEVAPGQIKGYVSSVVDGIRRELSEEHGSFDVASARRLRAIVMPDAIDSEIAKARRLYVVASGELGAFPYSLLVTDKPSVAAKRSRQPRDIAWLIRRQAVIVPVSLRMIGSESGRNQRMGVHDATFAGIGAPSLMGRPDVAMRGVGKLLRGGKLNAETVRALPALPDTKRELSLMNAAFGGAGRLITGDEATEETVRNADLSKYDVLAFATHALVSGELRGLTEPGLVLTPTANDDGVFTASDVANLKLNADWVILSACDTAAGESANAPMYSGLARAFVYAGARSLLLSHWQVRDDIASRLTVETVKASRRGMSRAEALRQAQLRLINDKSVKGGAHPALWAPFVLLGD